MTRHEILQRRLANQLLVSGHGKTIAEVGAWFGATQAQDHPQAKWALGSRVEGSTIEDIDSAIARRELVRTWTMRGTLHLMAPTDVHWINRFVCKRILSSRAATYRAFGMDTKAIRKIERLITSALAGTSLTRNELRALLESKRIATDGFRLAHIMYHLALEGHICAGTPRGKEDTFVLLDEWLPRGTPLTRDETLAALATRYFRSHGPATMRDFAWWAGIPQRDAMHGIGLIESSLRTYKTDGTYYALDISVPSVPSVLLLAGFDEYLLGYADRSLVVDDTHMRDVVTINGLFRPIVLIGGRAQGMWSRTVGPTEVDVTIRPFRTFKKPERAAIETEAERLAAFLGRQLQLHYE